MAKNIMPDIAKLLGVEINENFEIRVTGETKTCGTLCITDNNIVIHSNNDIWISFNTDAIYDLFNGSLEVVRKPFKPKYDETYWSYYFGNREKDWQIGWRHWKDDFEDYLRLRLNLCFRTEEEAEHARPRVYRELTGRKWQDK